MAVLRGAAGRTPPVVLLARARAGGAAGRAVGPGGVVVGGRATGAICDRLRGFALPDAGGQVAGGGFDEQAAHGSQGGDDGGRETQRQLDQAAAQTDGVGTQTICGGLRGGAR